MTDERVKLQDALRFEGDPLIGPHVHDWDGEWPPPERMAIAVGMSGFVRVFAADDELAPELLASESTQVYWFRRTAWSKLPPQYEEDNMRRGAKYEREP